MQKAMEMYREGLNAKYIFKVTGYTLVDYSCMLTEWDREIHRKMYKRKYWMNRFFDEWDDMREKLLASKRDLSCILIVPKKEAE